MKSLHFAGASWLFLCCIVYSLAKLQPTREISDEDRFLQEKYRKLDDNLKSIAKTGFKYLFPKLMQASEGMNLSVSCMANTLRVLFGARDLKYWALNFLDASGKVNSGYLHGDMHTLGNYDQCLWATVKKKNGETDFQGRYCLISARPLLPDKEKSTRYDLYLRSYENSKNFSDLLQFSVIRGQEAERYAVLYGLCVPTGCSVRDVKKMMKYVSDNMYLNITLEYCQTEKETLYHLSTRKIVIICIFVFFLLLGILSSVMEYYCKLKNIKFKGTPVKVLRCFSITTNLSNLLNTKAESGPLSCLHGIRVFSLLYLILAHKYLTLAMVPLKKDVKPNLYDYIPTFFFQIIANAFIITDVFLFMSGFLNMYLRKQLSDKGKHFSWWMMIIHRMWRLLPGYIFVILFTFILTPRGPYAQYFTQNFIENCPKEYWKNFLFINNFFQDEKCFIHSWFIACDTQLFFISLITVPIILKNPKKGFLVSGAVIVFGLLSTVLWVVVKKLPPAFLAVVDRTTDEDVIKAAYMSFPSHISTYFLGTLMGYYLSTKKDIKISKVYQLIGWVAASFIFISMLFMTYRWNNGIPYTPVESVLYFTFSKPLFALAVGWLMFCCITGHGGIINEILSQKFWIPLSRLAFTIYLISFPLQLFYLANLRSAEDTQWMITIWIYFGDICISSLIALVIGVVLEKPIFAIEKLIFSDLKRDTKTENASIVMTAHAVEENKNCVVIENEYNAQQIKNC